MKRKVMLKDPQTGLLREATDHELATLPGPFFIEPPEEGDEEMAS